jgi:hypothetical protein
MAGVKGRSGRRKTVTDVDAESPLAFLTALYRDRTASVSVRLRAAIAAARYVHRKPGVAKRENAAQAAKAAAEGRFALRAAPKLALVRRKGDDDDAA